MITISIKHLENIIEIAKDNMSKDADLTGLLKLEIRENDGIRVWQLHATKEKKNKLIGY